jgi:hypothetical protein
MEKNVGKAYGTLYIHRYDILIHNEESDFSPKNLLKDSNEVIVSA